MKYDLQPNFLSPYDFSALETFFQQKTGRRGADGTLALKVADIRDHLTARGSLNAKRAAQNLLKLGCIAEVGSGSPVPEYVITPIGERFYQRFVQASLDELVGIDSASWTGIVSPVEVAHVMSIVADIEAVARSIGDNEKQSQIIGLVTALRAILETPEPPRKPILSIVRDPAFAHIVEVGALLLLIATYLKT